MKHLASRPSSRSPRPTRGLAVAVGSVALLASASASAHISLEQGGTHKSRYGEGEIKAGPCGRANGTRGTNIYTYEPGQTITIKLVEFVSHPSYFRWAFDANGDSTFKEPASIKPIDPNRPCPIDNGDHCGAADYYNTPAVLPGMDDLNPHLAGAPPNYTFQVTLPNVECDNCTLQVIQVMEDNQFHGDYDPTPGVGVEDIYHQCIDLVLKHASTSDGGTPSDSGSGGGSGSGSGGGSGSGSGGGSGSGSGSGGSGSGGSGSGGSGDPDASTNGQAPSTAKGCAVSGPARGTGAGAMGGVAGLFALASVIRRRRRASR